MTSGTSKRKNNFRVDDLQAPNSRVTPADYVADAKRFDKGHLESADDFSNDDTTMSESFLMSNMHPQYISDNRGIWKKLEIYTRNLAQTNGYIYVTTGTIYTSKSEKIGIHKDVTVPDATYKIIYIPKINRFEAYIVPNTVQVPKQDLAKFRVTVSAIEQQTRIDFNPGLASNLLEQTK
jgi:endonuclease G